MEVEEVAAVDDGEDVVEEEDGGDGEEGDDLSFAREDSE